MVIDLHAKNQLNICKHLEKIWKTVWLLKFTKSKVHNFAKNRWSVTKLKLVIDLYAENQVIICKRFEKNAENCLIAEI